MTTDCTKAQLATVLSALDGKPRKPANKAEALKALARSTERLGLTSDDVLAAAPGLLDGRLDAAAWRAGLTDQPEPPIGERIAASLQVAFPDLPEGLVIEAQGDKAVLTDRLSKWVLAEAATDDAAIHAKWRKLLAGVRKKLAAGQPIAAGDPRVTQRGRAKAKPAAEPAPRRTREGSKQALLIALLRRPEGATIAQVAEATGWQPHTIRGAISGALKKKLGLQVTSTKEPDGPRVYRLA